MSMVVDRIARGALTRRVAALASRLSVAAPHVRVSVADPVSVLSVAPWLYLCGGDERLMIPRYTHPEMGRIWTEQRRYEAWLAVELAAADAMAEAGIIPATPRASSGRRRRSTSRRIEEIEQTTQHDVIAFTTAVAEHVGPAARWLHFGLTSSDVVDTALALQMRRRRAT